MKSTRRLTWSITLVALAFAVLVWREHDRDGRPWTFVFPELLAGLALIAAGLIVRWSRADNRCWWLLVAAGLAWWVGDFEHSLNRDVATAAFAFSAWQGLFLAWVLLAFPTGRLVHPGSRLLIAVLAALLAARTLSRLFLHVPPDVAGYGTRNRFLPISDDRWWRLVEDAFAWSFSAVILVVSISTAARWVGANGPARRMLTPALFAAAVLTASVAYEYVVGWNVEIPRHTGVRIHDVVLWAHAALAVALVVGIVRLRRTRAAVVDLVAELGDDVAPPRLGEALARALGDASVRLFPWSAPTGCYVDGDGRPVDVPPDGTDRAVTRIERHGRPIAVLLHDPALLEDPGMVNAVVAAVRLTIDNAQLQAELEAQLAEVAASRARIVAAADEQRRRIERDLHDGAQQRLVTIALALRLAEARLDERSDPAVREVLRQGVKDLGEAVDELRDLARGVHPAILNEAGLAAALESLVDRSPVTVGLDIDVAHEPPPTIGATAYFAVCEALANVAKHASADTVHVCAVTVDGLLRVTVDDDGVGGADPTAGSGLRGIADRVAAAGGTLRIDSRAGCGTSFQVDLPCASS
jgi:signal transduction histidine kinase